MITLYYHRGACSTSNHFALEDAGVAYEAIEVHLDRKDDPIAQKVRKLNPMSMTPVLVLEDGEVLTQNAATLSYIADLVPEKALLPKPGTLARAQADSWMAFVASDLHPVIIEYIYKGFGETDAERARLVAFYEDRVARRLIVLEERLAGQPYILGSAYSVIDGYALIVLNWSVPAGLSLDAYPSIRRYMEQIEARPTIRKVREAEGPIDW
ncbi:glutathione S-transferase family protein [Sulfitobacter sp. 20_GPM-1509m]|uniref:glutathione S-transferase family protein n=1 Tax=Sulfitobacter sp. 20_GPM-1509m TaxID=1380367 RepID=UPI000685CB40|nr:glutathione S-transferase family protein [Sulfitobacter sp. 20_GPM-1509m]